MRTPSAFGAAVLLFFFVAALDSAAYSSTPAAIAGRTLKDASPGCGSCHGGGTDPLLSVAVAGPRVVAAGASAIYTVTTSKSGVADGTVMGMAVAANGTPTPLSVVAGMPTVLDAASGEVIQSALVNPPLRSTLGGSASYQFRLTMPAGATPGESRTLYVVSRLAGTSWQFSEAYLVTTPLAAPSTFASPNQSVNSVSLAWSGGGPLYRLVYKPGTTAPVNENDGTVIDLGAVGSTVVSGLAGGSPYAFALYSRAAGNIAFSSGAATLAASTSVSYAVPTIFTAAGGGAGDGGPATGAIIENPTAVIRDAAGNVYIADSGNHRVRRVDAATGIITTLAGNGVSGFSGDGGPATEAAVGGPSGLARDSAGNLFISTGGRVRRVDAATGTIGTVAGTGISGFSGDLGQATSARLNFPAGVAVDGAGNLFIADVINHRIRKVVLATGVISTVAGDGTAGYFGDGVAATSTGLYFPKGVTIDGSGNLLVADTDNNRIRKVNLGTGIITTVAGTGVFGSTGDGGLATNARLALPRNVAVGNAGDLFIADTSSGRVRKVAAGTGVITSVAGCNSATCYDVENYPALFVYLNPQAVAVDPAGNLFIADSYFDRTRVRRVAADTGYISRYAGQLFNSNFTGDGLLARNARLKNPLAVALDPAGNLLIADTGNAALRRVEAATQIVSSVPGVFDPPNAAAVDAAGNIYYSSGSHVVKKVVAATGNVIGIAGTSGSPGSSAEGVAATFALLNTPSGIALDATGNIFIADTNNHRVRKVSAATGTIVTVAGTGSAGYFGDGGAATSAWLYFPTGVAVDRAGNLFIADRTNVRIRRVDAVTGVITTYAGNGSGTPSGDGGLATGAGLGFPRGVAIDAAGNLYVTIDDNVTHRVRKINAATGVISTVAGSGVRDASGDGGPATAAGLWNPANAALDAAGNLYIADWGNNRVRKVVSAAAIGLSVSAPAPLTFGTSVTLSAAVADGTTPSAGPVLFFDGNSLLCTAALASGTASCQTSALSAGTHSLSAVYGGGESTLSARSAPAAVVVAKATQTIAFTALGARALGDPPFSVSATGGASGNPVTFSSLTPGVCSTGGGNGATVTLVSAGTCSIAADQAGNANYEAAAQVTRSFVVTQQFALTVSKTGSGTVGSAPAGIDCGATCSASFNSGTVVTLNATPAAGSVFSGWSGACSGTGTCQVTMDAARSVTAAFAVIPQAPIASATPTSLVFAPGAVGSTSPPQTVSITNTGTGTLSVGSVSSTNSQFAVSHDCSSLAAGVSCTASVSFTPTALGARSGTLTVTTNGGAVSVSLAGTGIASTSFSANVSAVVTGYYETILGRSPDQAGLDFWAAEAARVVGLGADVREVFFAMSIAFFGSPEYLNKATSDTQYLTDLYRTFFEREPDAPGLAFWQAELTAVQSRSALLNSFLFSTEFSNKMTSLFGTSSVRPEVDMTIDLYRGTFGRLPDSGGFTFWLGQIRIAQCQGAAAVSAAVNSLASQFFNSPEYAARARVNRDFVGDVYNAYLRRGPGGDSGGFNFWVGQVPVQGRDGVRSQFVPSAEFQNRVTAVVNAGCTL